MDKLGHRTLVEYTSLARQEGREVRRFRPRTVVYGGLLAAILAFTLVYAGLIVAEIELADVDEAFVRPAWLGEEVSDDVRYYNSNLSKTPFTQW